MCRWRESVCICKLNVTGSRAENFWITVLGYSIPGEPNGASVPSSVLSSLVVASQILCLSTEEEHELAGSGDNINACERKAGGIDGISLLIFDLPPSPGDNRRPSSEGGHDH